MTRIGVIGCGNISEIYLTNLTQKWPEVTVQAITSRRVEKAKEKAQQYGIPVVCETNEELFARDDVDLVLILTTPDSHSTLIRQGLEAGKHVYCEKPLALSYEEGTRLVALAKEKHILLGCAPDTILGSGIQTCKRLLEQGAIGTPIAAQFEFGYPGPETWHPNPAFLYQKGAGPMMDIGPYYITALVYLLGPIARVCGLTRTPETRRTITSAPLYGQSFQVEVPTFYTGLLEFNSGAIGTFTMTFDANTSRKPGIQIMGTEGTLWVPDPDSFGGPDGSIELRKRRRDPSKEEEKGWVGIANGTEYFENSRGLGVRNMAHCVETGEKPVCDGAMALHVLDALLALSSSNPTVWTELKQ